MGVMCCDPVGNKVYCAAYDSGALAVIDCAGDSVLRVFRFGSAAKSITYSPDQREVFCGVDYYAAIDTLFVLDCVTDSIVAAVPVSDWPENQCYCPTNCCIYCLADYENLMTVIDCATNQAVAWIDLGHGQSSVCCAPPENKVFCATYDGRLVVVDAASNTVVDSLPEAGFFNRLFYNRLNNKVYCVSYISDSVVVIDAASDSVLKTIVVGDGPSDVAWNPVQNRVYIANYEGWSISVLRDSGGGVEETPSAEVRTTTGGATIVRGGLRLGAVGSRQNTAYRAELLDATGRKVMELHPGENDVRALAPGVYFIREAQAQAQAQAVRKVVIAE